MDILLTTSYVVHIFSPNVWIMARQMNNNENSKEKKWSFGPSIILSIGLFNK